MKSLLLFNLLDLVTLGIFIWMGDASWVDAAGNALPVLAAFPIFVWLTVLRKRPCSTGSKPVRTDRSNVQKHPGNVRQA